MVVEASEINKYHWRSWCPHGDCFSDSHDNVQLFVQGHIRLKYPTLVRKILKYMKPISTGCGQGTYGSSAVHHNHINQKCSL